MYPKGYCITGMHGIVLSRGSARGRPCIGLFSEAVAAGSPQVQPPVHSRMDHTLTCSFHIIVQTISLVPVLVPGSVGLVDAAWRLSQHPLNLARSSSCKSSTACSSPSRILVCSLYYALLSCTPDCLHFCCPYPCCCPESPGPQLTIMHSWTLIVLCLPINCPSRPCCRMRLLCCTPAVLS